MSFRCARLLDSGLEEVVFGEASAARGCTIGGWRRLYPEVLPLRGAARLRGGGGCIWRCSRCAGLLD